MIAFSKIPLPWRERMARYAPFVLLALAVFVAYGNVYSNEFLLDDEFLIIKNVYLRYWGSLPKLLLSCSTAGFGGEDSFYRPLQGLAYFFVFQIFGLSLFAFHFLNVALHAGNAVLVFTLGRRLGFDPRGAWVAALLWALHPVHTEAVTYISATADPMYAFFCLAGLCVLLPDFSPRRMMAGCALFVLALLAKETAVVFPALAVLCLFVVSGGRIIPLGGKNMKETPSPAKSKDLQRCKSKILLPLPHPATPFGLRRTGGERKPLFPHLARTLPLWILAGLYAFLRLFILDIDVHFYKESNVYTDNFLYRVYTFLATLPTYARLLLWPDDLHNGRGFPVFASFWFLPVLSGFVMAAASAAIFSITVLTRGKKALALSWGLAWFFVAHSLHTGLAMPVNALLYEHWLYLPSVGLALGAAQSFTAWLVGKGAGMRPRATVLFIGIFVVGLTSGLGTLTFYQNGMWRDSFSLYETVLRYGEKSVNAHNNLGMAYAERGDHRRAIDHYRAAIELNDAFAQPHHNIARALMALPDAHHHVDEAIKELQRAIAINPRFYQSYVFLAEIYEQIGEHEKARMYRQRGEEIVNSL